MAVALHARIEHWPFVRPFTISRGSRNEAVTLVVELTDGRATGRGESMPYARFGEDTERALDEVEALAANGIIADREALNAELPAGAVRNALDCALWDLEARTSGTPAWKLAGLPSPGPVLTTYTISLDSPAEMARQAAGASDRPLLKIKMGGSPEAEAERLRAVRRAVPRTRLVVDANEGWTPALYAELAPVIAEAGVELVEQPFPEGEDGVLAELPHPVPLCADESCRTRAQLDRVAGLYDCINIKLDKAGGLTEAIALHHAARERGLGVFLGCMMAGSLAIAPALLLAGVADFVDLDGPLYLRHDREGGVCYEGATLHPPPAGFWG